MIRALPLTLYFAEAAGCVEAWREAMKGWDVIKSQVWEEWCALAEKKGRRDDKVDILLRFLRRKQANLEQTILAIEDLARLDAAIDSAASSASLEDFRQATGL